jgi:hypothetical protein
MLRIAKRNQFIAEEEVPVVFDDASVVRLAGIGKLPTDADIEAFGDAIREAARTLAREALVPTENKLHHEIAALAGAADRRQYERVATLLPT